MHSQTFASSAFTRTILSHAEAAGLPVDDLLHRAGIEPSWFEDQHQQIPACLVDRLWLECEKAGAGRHFGCELIHGMATSSLQGINILLDSAATLRASLACFTQYLPLVTNHVIAELVENGHEAHLHLRPVQTQPHFFALDAATMSLVRNIARRLGKPPGQVFTRVVLDPDQAAGDFLQDLGIAVERGTYPCLVLPQAVLELPLLSANPFLHQSMLGHWQAAAPNESRNDGLQLARHWLTAGDQPIERIAERLGYRQPSNFIRAFRKQFGITPKQFRLGSL
ncbi:AraC family transcriptional regulator [Pseudomonas akapageensis]|uniref:AraC family transcriptional regulator n=1 Tax=Pseudomonas akapageensis TaxID=2609961 RepID=UPI00140D2411|nr:AraC family transcriptional regulator [Pseudomonas akapageensis]